MTFGSLFSGIEGFGEGLIRAGMTCAFQCEQDKSCIKVLERHYPDVERLTDVKKLRGKRLRSLQCDLLCGGFPCQDLSVAGRRAGLAGKRSGLFWEMRRIIQTLLPGWFLLENVPGLLSSQEGQDFNTVIASLVELGYGVAWRVLDSQYFHLAQRRERVFIVGSLGTMRCAEVLFESESVSGDSPPRREAGEGAAGTIGARVDGGGFPGTDGACAGHVATHTYTQDLCFALTAKGGRFDPTNEAFVTQAYRASGNCGEWSTGDKVDSLCTATDPNSHVIAHTLRGEGHDASEDGTGRQTYVMQERMESLNPNNSPGGRYGVRRLTPRECERLQGFPDDWTRWDAAGKEIADSPRYRMIGNAVSVPVAEWIGRRIMEAANHDR